MHSPLVALWLLFVGAASVAAGAAIQNRDSVKSQALNGSRTGSNKVAGAAVLPAPTTSGGNRWNITDSSPQAPAGAVKVNSKQGRALARMQNKRQADGSQWATSRRNEDPWFLDQPPYPLQPYRFVYNIKGKNGQTEQYRQEVGDGKYLSGSYGYVLPDGIYRHVDYVADERGFRAFIRTSEPGTANENPANVVIASDPVVVAPGVTYARNSAASSLAPLPASASLPPVPPSNLYSAAQSVASLPVDSSLSWINRERDNLEQVRRPPGSIVGTSLRNFSSYSFTTQPPTLFQTLAGQEIKQPNINSAEHRLYQQQADDNDQFGRLTRLASPKPIQANPQQVQYNGIHSTPTSTSAPASTYNLRPLTADVHQRSGSSLLSYDQPLGFQGASGLDSNKLSYDNKHTLHADAPLLAQERARALLQLERFNAAGVGPALHYLRPPGADLGVLNPPVSQSPDRQLVGKQRTETSSSRSSTSSSSSSSTSSSSGLSADGRLIPLGAPTIFNKVREQSSGTKSGSVRELELYQHRSDSSEQDAPLQLVPLPAAPRPTPAPPVPMQLSFPPIEPTSPAFRPASSGAVKGRLQAPYADFGSTSVNSPTSGSQLIEDKQPEGTKSAQQPQQQSAGSQQESADQEAKRAPWSERESEREDKEREREPVRRHLNEEHWQQGPHVRSVDAPEARDIRSALAMNDLRSMQNMIGLPQPPRLQSPSVSRRTLHNALELTEPRRDLTEKLVAARMNRVEALLGAAPNLAPPPPTPLSSGQAASSTRRSVVADSNELEKVTHSQSASAPKSRLKTGPVIRLSPGEAPADLSATNASDAQFDARRLSQSDRAAAKLQAEKVSELEKFQQRLKAQQLLLEQTKQSAADKQQQASANRTAASLGGRPGRELINSQVSYDDDESNEVSKLPSRPRRQNEQIGSSTTEASPQASSDKPKRSQSDLAKQIQSWPSVIAASEPSKPAANKSQEEQPAGSKNTVNMEFINSVTSLGANQLNPFSGARAGSSVQRGVATASARYFNSPELLAALDDPARHETSARLQSLFGSAGESSSLASASGSNHRAAPYMASDSQQHGSFTAGPALATPSGRHRPSAGLTDGFEVRDRALEMERFYEVVSSADAAAPVAGQQHRAFRG